MILHLIADIRCLHHNRLVIPATISQASDYQIIVEEEKGEGEGEKQPQMEVDLGIMEEVEELDIHQIMVEEVEEVKTHQIMVEEVEGGAHIQGPTSLQSGPDTV